MDGQDQSSSGERTLVILEGGEELDAGQQFYEKAQQISTLWRTARRAAATVGWFPTRVCVAPIRTVRVICDLITDLAVVAVSPEKSRPTTSVCVAPRSTEG